MSAFVLGVDTNVLVRFLADDDDLQTPLAVALFTNERNHPVFLSVLVMAESFTVLTRVKKFPPAQVISTMRKIVSGGQFELELPDLILAALDDAERVGCGLTDALIARQNLAAGCVTTATFDKRAQRLSAMTAVEDGA